MSPETLSVSAPGLRCQRTVVGVPPRLPVSPSWASYFCFASPAATKVAKTIAPTIRPRPLARSGFVHSIAAPGGAAKGRPAPSRLSRPSWPLNPLRDDSVHPDQRGASAPSASPRKKNQSQSDHRRCGLHPGPLQEAEWRCCAGGYEAGRRARREGAGRPFAAGPRSSAGTREVRSRSERTRMVGCPSLWLLSLGHARESDSPCRAKPVVPSEESATFPRPSAKPQTPDPAQERGSTRRQPARRNTPRTLIAYARK